MTCPVSSKVTTENIANNAVFCQGYWSACNQWKGCDNLLIMNFIVVFLIPAAFVYYSAGRSESGRLTESIAAIAGLASGLCAIIVDHLFFPLFAMPVTTYYPKLIILFFSDTFIPVVVGLLPLFFLSDSPVRQKISLLRPQFFGVTALYLPYKMLVFYNFSDVWAMVFIPLMILSVLFLFDFFIGRLLSKVSGTPDLIDMLLTLIPVIFALICIDVSITLWFFCYSVWIYLLISLFIVCSALVLRIAKYYR